MRKKTVALVILLVLMAGTICVTSAPLAVAPGASVGLYGFVTSICGPVAVFADPVPGGSSGGGD